VILIAAHGPLTTLPEADLSLLDADVRNHLGRCSRCQKQ